MCEAKNPRYRRPAALPFLLLLALFAGGVAGQQQQQLPMSRGLQAAMEQLTELTNGVANIISESFGFCIADP
jgi:uncharacterized protein HemX